MDYAPSPRSTPPLHVKTRLEGVPRARVLKLKTEFADGAGKARGQPINQRIKAPANEGCFEPCSLNVADAGNIESQQPHAMAHWTTFNAFKKHQERKEAGDLSLDPWAKVEKNSGRGTVSSPRALRGVQAAYEWRTV